MKISTRVILIISFILLGYFTTLIVGHSFRKRTELKLNNTVTLLFPAVIESRKALFAFEKQTKAYEEMVIFGEIEFLDKAKVSYREAQESLDRLTVSGQLPIQIKLRTKEVLRDMKKWAESANHAYARLAVMDIDMDMDVVNRSKTLAEEQRNLRSKLTNIVSTLTMSLTNEHRAIVRLTRIQEKSDIFLLLAVTVIALVSSLMLLRKIVRPIQSLAETARLIQEGELDKRAQVKSKDEIGDLANAFNAMTDKLGRAVHNLELEVVERILAQEEVARHRDHLEELVKERTIELTMINTELRSSEKQNRVLFETASEAGIGILVVQDEDEERGIIKFANPVMLRLTGYSKDEIMKTNMLDLLHSDCHEQIITNYTKRISGDSDDIPQKVEYIGLTKEKKKIPIEISAGETVYNGKSALVSYISDISSRKAAEAKLVETQKELINKAQKAGMADIATGTLHNVGNILNSVKTSTDVVGEIFKNSQISGLKKANSLLKDNLDSLEDFICTNPKGKKLMRYYLKIEEGLEAEHSRIGQHLHRLTDKVAAIEDVIVAQQNYAGTNTLSEECLLHEIIDDALTMQSGTTERYNIKILKRFKDIPKVKVQKIKLVHILINLIRNSKDAMSETPSEKRVLTFSIYHNEKSAYLKVIDTGHGIQAENLKKVFTHGFTTKTDGHGFGLHSSANYMTEMGGEMWAESEGEGLGATLVLKFPVEG